MLFSAGGVIEVNADKDPELFKMARVGLGCLGVVTELTLQAVPAQKLKEKTFVATAKEVSLLLVLLVQNACIAAAETSA